LYVPGETDGTYTTSDKFTLQLSQNHMVVYKNDVLIHTFTGTGGTKGAKLWFYEQGASLKVLDVGKGPTTASDTNCKVTLWQHQVGAGSQETHSVMNKWVNVMGGVSSVIVEGGSSCKAKVKTGGQERPYVYHKGTYSCGTLPSGQSCGCSCLPTGNDNMQAVYIFSA